MPTYNGHKNHAHWNVSLWLSNDEGLYNLCRDAVRECRTLDDAAECILDSLRSMPYGERHVEGTGKGTPDGVMWTKTAIRAALSGGSFA